MREANEVLRIRTANLLSKRGRNFSDLGGWALYRIINDLTHFLKPGARAARLSGTADRAALLWSPQLKFQLARNSLHTLA
jgi:hypothetical protein